MTPSRSTAMVVAGVLLLSVTLIASAATAPSREVDQSRPPLDTTQSTETTETANTTEPGVLIGLQGAARNYQREGAIVRLTGTQESWRISDRNSYFDVTPLPNGSVVAGFMHSGYERGCGPYEPPCHRTGFRIIDPTGEPTATGEWSFPVRNPTHSEVHDVEPLGDGRFLISDMEHERIAIVANGSVSWEWRAADSGFYDAPPDPTKRDWLHINDVDVIGEDRYLISVRNANQLLIIERGEGIVDVINEDRSDSNDGDCTKYHQLKDFDGDGDVRCGDSEVMDHQHNPQWLGNGSVLVADSENNRVVELHRNASGHWTPVWGLDSAGGLGLQWPRDADRLDNGNTLVTDSLNRRVFEVTTNGTVVWSTATEVVPYEADPVPGGELTTYDVFAPSTNNSTTTNESTLSYNGSNAVAQGGEVPGLTLALAGLQALYPRLPIWFNELQLGVSLLALCLVGAGLVIELRERRRE